MITKFNPIKHKQFNENGELYCHRNVRFLELRKTPAASVARPWTDNCIRVYGGLYYAALQLRGVGPITVRGKDRRMIAKASLDKKECLALAKKLTDIAATLDDEQNGEQE